MTIMVIKNEFKLHNTASLIKYVIEF